MDPKLDHWLPRLVAALRKVGYDAVAVDVSRDDVETESVILFPYHGVVIRATSGLMDGIGCCLYDARKHQIKPILLLIRAGAEEVGAVKIARRTLDGNVPAVDLWVLTESDASLDMGDGRVITVA